MKKGDPRGTYAWQRRRLQYINEAQARGWPCELCGRPIVFDATPRTRWSPSIDHVLPIAVYGVEAASAGPLRVVHYGCNSRRGAREYNTARASKRQPIVTVTSRTW